MTERAHWNGTHVVGRIKLNGIERGVAVDRDTVHRHAPGYSDAITWELDRFAQEILEKLTPYFEAKGLGQAA